MRHRRRCIPLNPVVLAMYMTSLFVFENLSSYSQIRNLYVSTLMEVWVLRHFLLADIFLLIFKSLAWLFPLKNYIYVKRMVYTFKSLHLYYLYSRRVSDCCFFLILKTKQKRAIAWLRMAPMEFIGCSSSYLARDLFSFRFCIDEITNAP